MSCILIVGAGEAGMAAAGALRDAGFGGRVLLVGEEAHHPYARPPLSKAVLTDDPCPIEAIRNAEWLGAREIELWLGAKVAAIDTTARTATIDRSGASSTVHYTQVLLTTGTRPRRLPMLVALGDRAACLRTWDDALGLRARLARARSVAIVGGGVIGLEVASSAVKLGLAVTAIEPANRLMARALAPSGSARLLGLHRAAGIDIRMETNLVSAVINGEQAMLTLDDDSTVAADLVVEAIGVVPNDALARSIGCAVDNGVLVDGRCATNVAHIFAAGDVARFAHPLFDEPIRVEAWQHARRHGAHAAAAMLGETRSYAEIPWFWTDQHGTNIQVAGLPGLADTHVDRGATTLHLKGDRLVAATTVDNGRDMRPAIKMISGCWTGPASTLADPVIPLARIAQAAANQPTGD